MIVYIEALIEMDLGHLTDKTIRRVDFLPKDDTSFATKIEKGCRDNLDTLKTQHQTSERFTVASKSLNEIIV